MRSVDSLPAILLKPKVIGAITSAKLVLSLKSSCYFNVIVMF
jgi:hypothetical protein